MNPTPLGIPHFLRPRTTLLGLAFTLILLCSSALHAAEDNLIDSDDDFQPASKGVVESPPTSTTVTPPSEVVPDDTSESKPDDPKEEPSVDDDPIPPKSSPPKPESSDIIPMGGENTDPKVDDIPLNEDPSSSPVETNRPPMSDPNDFPVRRDRDPVTPAAGEVNDSPSGADNDEADYSKCRFSYAYKGPFGVFHLTNRGGTAHYRTCEGKRFLSMLAPPSKSNPQQTIDLPVCCKKFIYFIPERGCGDPSIIAWAFSREPCGPNGFVAMKHVGGKWKIHSWCRRDVICDTCFPPPPPHPPCPHCHAHPCQCFPHCHHACHPCWIHHCWPIWLCRPHFGNGFAGCSETGCGFGPGPSGFSGDVSPYDIGDEF